MSFRAGTLYRSAWRCSLADETCDGRVEAHHIITRQTLRRLAELGLLTGELELALGDDRNGLALCASHHHRVERGSITLTRDDLPEVVEGFAEDYGCAAELDAKYGTSRRPDERPVARAAARRFGELRQRRANG